MWKAPYRPREESISQSYNDGLVQIYAVTSDEARPGYQPKPGLTPKGKLAFEVRRVGIQRYYQAQQNQVQIDKVIRVQRGFPITTQDVAVVVGEKDQYEIYQVQTVDDVYPPSYDLTLTKIKQKIAMAEEVTAP